MTNHTFHVYASSPDDGRVHYVGQTFKITDRFKQQVALARRRVGYGPHCATTDRRERWLCDLARRDLEPILARAVSLTPGPAPSSRPGGSLYEKMAPAGTSGRGLHLLAS